MHAPGWACMFRMHVCLRVYYSMTEGHVCRSVTSRAHRRQQPQGVSSAWQPDTLLSDCNVMSNLTFEPSLIYRIGYIKCPINSEVVIIIHIHTFHPLAVFCRSGLLVRLLCQLCFNTCFEKRDQSCGKAQQKPSRAADHKQSQIFGYGAAGRCIEDIFSSLLPRWGFLQLSECILGFWGRSPGRWRGEIHTPKGLITMSLFSQAAHHCWHKGKYHGS